MKTYVAKKGDLEQKWFLVDASGIPLGRLASKVAHVLRGKGKPQYTPNLDCGDHVVIVNAAKVRLTGNKLQNKTLKRHSGFQGGLRTDKYQDLMAQRPEKVTGWQGHAAQNHPGPLQFQQTARLRRGRTSPCGPGPQSSDPVILFQ